MGKESFLTIVGNKYSSGIYIIHVCVIDILRMILPEDIQFFHVMYPVLVFAVATMFLFFFNMIKRRLYNMSMK